MKHSYKTLIAFTLIAAMLASGCSGARSAGGERRQSTNEACETVAASMDSYLGSDPGFYGEEAAYEGEYSYSARSEATSDNVAPAGGYSGTEASTPAVTDNRMLIRNVSVSCETLNFTEVTSNLESQVASLGGYIESKNFNGTGNARDLRSATYTIRITSDGLDQIVNLIGNAAVITYANESTEDVTLTYADTQARVESLRVEQETLNNLLAQADSLDIVLQLQNELTNVRYQIESYESQLRVLENLSSFSTLSITINEVIEETEPEPARVKTYGEKVREAFNNGLQSAKESLQAIGLNIAENAIGIAVFIVLAAAAFIVVKVLIKKRKKKMKAHKEVKPAEPVTTTEDKAGK